MGTTWPGRGVAAALVAAGLLLAFPLRVGAHARITAVSPAPSSTVPGPLPQVILTYNEPVDRDLFRVSVQGDSGEEVVGKPVFQNDRTIVAQLRPDAAGYMVVTWLAVGLDAHPVQGQYYFGIVTPQSRAEIRNDITRVSARVGAFESGAGAAGLTGAIEAGRAIEIVLLYLVLGIVLIGVLVLRPRLALAGAGAAAGTTGNRARRALLISGVASVVLMPILFWLYADRLTELIPGIGIGRIVASSIGVQWAIKALLWLALVGLVAAVVRRSAQGREQDRRMIGALVALAIALAGAFVAGTHVGTGSIDPGWLYIPMMTAHILLTAFWAGGLLAILLVVMPSRDSAQIWDTVSGFSRIMTVTAGILVVTGLLLLVKLLANLNALWCTTYGVVAGFKVSTVALALVFGLVNNRIVAAHRSEEELPPSARRGRRGGPTIGTLRRVLIGEATLLLCVLILAAILGETQLPPLFTGRALPGDVQTVVNPGLFGSGCQ